MSRTFFFDTNLFIYLLDGSGEPARLISELLTRMAVRKDQLPSPTLTLGEVLVKPYAASDEAL